MAPRGRPPSAKTLVDRQLGRTNKPMIPVSDGFIVPNHSGISTHPEMLGDKGFVKKTGDTMTGPITINGVSGDNILLSGGVSDNRSINFSDGRASMGYNGTHQKVDIIAGSGKNLRIYADGSTHPNDLYMEFNTVALGDDIDVYRDMLLTTTTDNTESPRLHFIAPISTGVDRDGEIWQEGDNGINSAFVIATNGKIEFKTDGVTRVTIADTGLIDGAGNPITTSGLITGGGFDSSSNKITNVTTPTADNDGANKIYVDGQNLWESGAGNTSLKTAETLTMQSEKIVLLSAGTTGTDAVNKTQMDSGDSWANTTDKRYIINKTIYAPEFINDEIPLFYLDDKEFANGATVLLLSFQIPANNAYTLIFKEMSGSPPTADATIETLSTTSGQNKALVEDGSINNPSMEANDYLYVNIPNTTGIDWVNITAILERID